MIVFRRRTPETAPFTVYLSTQMDTLDLPVDHLVALQEEAAALQEEPATTSHHLSVPIRSPSSL